MKKILFIIFALFLFNTLYSQDIPEPPDPVPPLIDIDLTELNAFKENIKKNESTYLKRLGKEIRAELQSVKKLDEERYYEMLRESYFNQLGHFYVENKEEKELMQLDEMINNLEMRSEIIALRYAKEKNADKQKMEKELLNILSNVFEKKEELRMVEIKRIENELTILKNSIAVRREHKEEIIRNRLRELLGQDEYLDWD